MDTRIIQLLARKLSGEATAEELAELDELLTRNPEGVYYAELIGQLWDEGKMRAPMDTDILYMKHIARHRPDFRGLGKLSVKPVIETEERLIETGELRDEPFQRPPLEGHGRRYWVGWAGVAAAVIITLGYFLYHGSAIKVPVAVAEKDRDYWLQQLDRLARPVLYHLAQDDLKKSMPVVLSLRTDDAVSRTRASYLEAFGRVLAGVAPWLEGEGGSAKEVALRNQYRAWALDAIRHATDTAAADHMAWDSPEQALVDAAFFAYALVRCPWLWEHLDTVGRRHVVEALVSTRKIRPGFNNWILFSGIIEAFFCQYGLPWDEMRVDYAIRQMEQWYVGDGLYSDGPKFHDDYYNSYVIHPFLTTITDIVYKKNGGYAAMLERFRQRDERYALIQERLINTDGSYPVLGRSVVYRGAVFQHLADMAWKKRLPVQLKPAQVRCALTAVLRRTMEAPSTYTKEGWLNIGVYGSQPGQADIYNTTGSLYLCSAILLPLGLPDTDEFWSGAAEPWTAQKIWSGQDVSGDHSID
ncbi:MAG: DUF2264 domain-containing protein [Sphingobacteriales bacterium]|nr:DUF2264 domain-containing protein [Sphingobacteriales bacterium]